MGRNVKLLNYLLDGNKLTRLKYFKVFNRFELSARIGEIETDLNIIIDKEDLIIGDKKVKEYSIKDKNYVTNRIKNLSKLQ